MAGLSPANMLQRDWRVDKFIDKYKNEDPFELNLGGKVTLVYDKEKSCAYGATKICFNKRLKRI